MTDKDRQKRLDKTQLQVLFKVPFFAPGVARLPVEFTDDPQINTAATNGEHILWNRAFFDGLTDSQVRMVNCHEVLHPALGHLWRAPAAVDWDVWNQATDHAVNNLLDEFNEQEKAKGLAEPFEFPTPREAYCCNPAFKGMNEERIYQILIEQKQNGGGQGQKQGQGGQPAPHSMPGIGQMQQPGTKGNAADPAQQAKNQNQWQSAVQQMAQVAKGRGSLPGSLSRFIDGLSSSKVPWYELLRSWLHERASEDYNFMVPDPCFDPTGFVVPSLESDRIGTVVFGIDWSGSTQWVPGLLDKFHAERQSCLDELKPRKLVDLGFDTRVVWEKEYGPGDVIEKKVGGGGGTCFKDLFRKVEAMNPQPKCVVVLTDLDGSFPDKAPEMPVLWVTWGEHSAPPFGEVVNVSE